MAASDPGLMQTSEPFRPDSTNHVDSPIIHINFNLPFKSLNLQNGSFQPSQQSNLFD